MLKLRLALLIILAIFGINSFSLAKDHHNSTFQLQSFSEIFVCVEPVVDTNPAYLMYVRNTNSFGVVVLEDARVTVYGENSFTTLLHSIHADSQSGGYAVESSVALAISGNSISSNAVCESLIENYPARNLTSTITLPVTNQYMISIDTSTPSNFVRPTIRGVFSFHFQQYSPRFQIVQQDAGSIEISFPFLTNPVPANNTFIVISNKSLSIEEEFTTGYGNQVTTLEREFFVQELTEIGEDLFLIMATDMDASNRSTEQQSSACIYPHSGYVYPYSAGKFLRLSANAETPGRGIKVGDTISALDHEGFRYYALTNPSASSELAIATVRNVNNENGQLIVGVEGQSDLVVTYPCLVEHTPQP